MNSYSIKPKNKILGIEACRGIAAVFVVFYHVSLLINTAYKTSYIKEILHFGHSGVDFFFVISGFIILFIHYDDIDRPSRLLYYARQRFTRLMPTYWVALVISVIMLIIGGHEIFLKNNLAWSLFLLPSNKPLIIGVAWTLRCEIFFYIVFCTLIFNKRIGLFFIFSWLVLTILYSVYGFKFSFLPGQAYTPFNIEFFFGMLVAYACKNYDIYMPSYAILIGIFAFFISAVLEDMHVINGYHSMAKIFYGIPSAFIIFSIVSYSKKESLNIPTFLRLLGSASYSIYLFQFIFIGTVWQFIIKTNLNLSIPVFIQFIFLVSAAVIGGIITSRMIEHPLIGIFRSRKVLPPDKKLA